MKSLRCKWAAYTWLEREDLSFTVQVVGDPVAVAVVPAKHALGLRQLLPIIKVKSS